MLLILYSPVNYYYVLSLLSEINIFTVYCTSQFAVPNPIRRTRSEGLLPNLICKLLYCNRVLYSTVSAFLFFMGRRFPISSTLSLIKFLLNSDLDTGVRPPAVCLIRVWRLMRSNRWGPHCLGRQLSQGPGSDLVLCSVMYGAFSPLFPCPVR